MIGERKGKNKHVDKLLHCEEIQSSGHNTTTDLTIF